MRRINQVAEDRRLEQGAWLFLTSLTVFFLSCTFLYAIYVMFRLAPQSGEIQPFYLPRLFILTTVNMLAISVLLHMAVEAVQRERRIDLARYIILAFILGIAFFAVQGSALAWMVSEMLRPTGSKIGFDCWPCSRIFEKPGELALDLIAFPFTDQEIAQPVQRLDDAHRRSPGPEQLAGRRRTKGDRDVPELDRAASGVCVHHDFGRHGVSQAQIVRCGHAVDKHPCLISAPYGVDNRAWIGRVRFLGELIEARLIVETAIDPSEGSALCQPLQCLVDRVSRSEVDEITWRPGLARYVGADAPKYGCLQIGRFSIHVRKM